MAPSSLEEVLDCSISVIHGKVISGEMTVKEFKFRENTLEEEHGDYKVQVLENILGDKYEGVLELKSEFSALMIGGMLYTYPAPGLECNGLINLDRFIA